MRGRKGIQISEEDRALLSELAIRHGVPAMARRYVKLGLSCKGSSPASTCGPAPNQYAEAVRVIRRSLASKSQWRTTLIRIGKLIEAYKGPAALAKDLPRSHRTAVQQVPRAERRSAGTAWEMRLRWWLSERQVGNTVPWFTLTEAACYVWQIPAASVDRGLLLKLASALRKLGYVRRTVQVGAIRRSAWRCIDTKLAAGSDQEVKTICDRAESLGRPRRSVEAEDHEAKARRRGPSSVEVARARVELAEARLALAEAESRL